MEKIFEHIDAKYNTDFYLNFNSLEPTTVKNESVFGQDWTYTAKSIGTKKHPHYEFDKSKLSAKDVKTFEENYANPLCGVQLSRRILNVEKTDEKVSIKIFLYERSRKPGRPYFVKATGLYFLTYNYKTNSLYNGSLLNYHLKRKCKKTLRRAGLWEDPVDVFKNRIKDYFNTSFTSAGVIMDNIDLDLPIQKFIESIPNINEKDDEPKYSLYKNILVTGGAKLPNNWKALIEVYPQPKKTDYKKVGFKYIDAFMLIHNLKGDKLKRILHTLKKINFSSYHFMLKFFGPKFLLSKPDGDLKQIFESNVSFGDWSCDVELTNSELKNCYGILMEACLGNIDYPTIIDHINIKQRLIKHEIVKWKSKTLNEFIDEHDEWSKLISSYTKGVITRRYSKEFKNSVERPISVNGDVYYPILLTNTDEYNNESTIQINCVRTYIDRPDCFIISLRKGDLNSNERLTNEFALSFIKDDLKIKRVQTKAKRNSQPDISWSEVLDILDEKVKYLNEQKLFTLPEKDIEYKLGLGKHSEAIIYNTGNYSTIIWDDSVEKMKLHDTQYYFQNDFDDLPL